MIASAIRWITLEQKHIDFADKVARRRRAYAIQRNRPAYFGAPTENDAALELDLIGARAELAAKLFLNPVKWHAFEERTVTDLPDLEDFIDVKGVPFMHLKLIVKPTSPDHWANLLVCAECHPQYAIIGWVWAKDAKHEKYLFNPRNAKQVAHFISQNDPIMMPPDDLFNEIRRRQNNTDDDSDWTSIFAQADGKSSPMRSSPVYIPERTTPESLPAEPFLHYCHCGKWGSFGYRVNLRKDQLGQWYCLDHRPVAGVPAT